MTRKVEAESCSLSKTKVDIKVEASVCKVSTAVTRNFFCIIGGRIMEERVQISTNEIIENNRI